MLCNKLIKIKEYFLFRENKDTNDNYECIQTMNNSHNNTNS